MGRTKIASAVCYLTVRGMNANYEKLTLAVTGLRDDARVACVSGVADRSRYAITTGEGNDA